MQHECNSMQFLQGNMHLPHRVIVGTTTGYGNPRTLKINGTMIGQSIGSNNHIRMRKMQGDWTLLQSRQLQELMLCWKRKVKRKKYIRRKMIHIQYVTLNDMAQLAKMHMAIGTKCGLAQREHNLRDRLLL